MIGKTDGNLQLEMLVVQQTYEPDTVRNLERYFHTNLIVELEKRKPLRFNILNIKLNTTHPLGLQFILLGILSPFHLNRCSRHFLIRCSIHQFKLKLNLS
jgi:hypothetical protein